jgi:hypothetical protein
LIEDNTRDDYQKLRKNKMTKLREKGYKERKDTPQVLPSSAELLNAENSENYNSSRNYPMPSSHLGCGYNSSYKRRGRISARVFVLGLDGKPLTPCKSSKARKLLEGGKAKPIWNKFGKFGIQMFVETGKEIPKTALGIDFGTKFEGYSSVVGKENALSVMWKLPNKKQIVGKLEERRQLRRARRQRNCRRREARFDNRNREGFISPSQKVIIDSRLKVIKEFFKCYPITEVALEDVKFNHRDNRFGSNFSTVEIGKKTIEKFIRERANLTLFDGYDTEKFRKKYHLKKTNDKGEERFEAHNSDALSIATEVSFRKYVQPNNFLIVDDIYRPVRRRLHDTQFKKGGIREKYSTGNFRGIRKGTICSFGQICGGKIRDNSFCIRTWKNKIIERANPIFFSHHFKTKNGEAFFI